MVQNSNGIEARAIPPDDGGANGGPLPSSIHLTEEQFRSFLQNLATNAGCNAALGRRLDVSPQLIDYVLTGKRRPGPRLLEKLNASVARVYTIVVEASNE